MSSLVEAVKSATAKNKTFQKQLAGQESTVLAAFVAHNELSQTNTVLSMATGTKCLGQCDLQNEGLVLNDCHAEILARRALLRYLYCEQISIRASSEHNPNSLFKKNPHSEKLQFKHGVRLYMYISESPCGDAAIYRLKDDVLDEYITNRKERENQDASFDITVRNELKFTGAKSNMKKRKGSDDSEILPKKKFDQEVGIARVKSGRSDLPPSKRTLSMSCSDKIAKWMHLGVQGTLLLNWYEPLFIQSIQVSKDENAFSSEVQKQALQRAVYDRFQDTSGTYQPFVHPCELDIVNTMYPSLVLSPEKKPSPLALSWSRNEAHWKVADVEHELTKFCKGDEVERLMAATGLKQGAKKISQLTSQQVEKVASRLSKKTLLRAFVFIKTKDGVSKEKLEEMTYSALKEQVAAGSNMNGMGQVTHLDRQTRFKKTIGDWVGVPESYKQFTIA